MKRIKTNLVSIIAGGAGFIGANLCLSVIEEGRTVVIIDNFMRGRRNYFSDLTGHPRLHFIEADLSQRTSAQAAFVQAMTLGSTDEVWHLAANSDIPAGVEDPDVDLRHTFSTTAEILRCMSQNRIRKLYFASSSAIYGNLGDQPLEEDSGPLLPISNYGAAKLASEAIISAAAESQLERACLFRFPNVVGVPATHGVILDFVRKLKSDGCYLDVLGNGTQRKAYLHVSDLIEAMLFIRSRTDLPKVLPINVGPLDQGVYVRWIAEQVVRRVSAGAEIRFGIESRGWVGDVPTFHYSTSMIQSLGWEPKLGSEAAVLSAIDEIARQEGCGDSA